MSWFWGQGDALPFRVRVRTEYVLGATQVLVRRVRKRFISLTGGASVPKLIVTAGMVRVGRQLHSAQAVTLASCYAQRVNQR